MQRAIYLIGFSSRDLRLTSSQAWFPMAGISSADIGNIRCWTKEIERDQFEGPEAEKNLANIEWLTPRVLAHDTAVTALSTAGPFVPARFGTLFSSPAALDQYVGKAHAAIHQLLDRIRGKQEWGIKCYIYRSLGLSALASVTHQSIDCSADNGTDYLKARRRKRGIEMELDQWLESRVKEAEHFLASRCSELVIRPRSMSSESSGERQLAGNFAILANQETASTIREAWDTQGPGNRSKESWNMNGFMTLEWSGPWPVYSFAVSLEANPSDQQIEKIAA